MLGKKEARVVGIGIHKSQGTEENGRVTRRDVENYKPSAAPALAAAPTSKGAASAPIVLPQVVGKESFEEVPVSQMRKTIARRLAESKFTAPHFYLTMEINMDKAVEARNSINEVSPIKISFNDMFFKTAAAALRHNPNVNV